LNQIAELDEFKGSWHGFARLHPEQLKALKKYQPLNPSDPAIELRVIN
jgi:hypothetical protein